MNGPFSSRISRLPQMFDAERAARTLEALGERAGEGPVRDLIAAAASNSPYLARLLEREADNLERDLSGDPRVTFAALQASVRFDETPARGDMMRRLREAKRRASLLIALSDLGGVVCGECLLALIDDEQRRSGSEIDVADGLDRMLAGRHDDDLPAMGDVVRTDPCSNE